MSTQHLSLLALEEAAAAAGRAYGRERLRERLQQIAEQQGSICPRSSLRLKDACFRDLPLETTLGRVTIRAHYGYNPQSQRWMFPVKELWGLAAHQEVSPYLEQLISYTATECGSYQKAQQMAASWGVNISATSIHKHVQHLGAKAQQLEQIRARRALDAATRPEVARQAQAQAPNALQEYSLVISMDAWKARERGPDWGLKPPEAQGERVAWKDLKLAVLYRLYQLVEKAPPQTDPTAKPRRQILQKFWVASPSDTPPEEFGRLVDGQVGYGATAFCEKAIASAGKFEGYEPLLVEIAKFFKTGKAPMTVDQTLEIYAFMEAADESLRQGGRPVSIEMTLARSRTEADARRTR